MQEGREKKREKAKQRKWDRNKDGEGKAGEEQPKPAL